MPPGTYYVLVCADDLEKVAEINEANNCRASSAVLVVGRPDLVATAVSDPPPVITPGGTFSVTDTVANQGTAMSGASTTRYYFALTTSKTADSKLLTGTRAVTALAAGAPPSRGTKTVTVPTTTALGTYYLLACADDLARVIELNESPNCVASATQVTVARPDLTVTVLSNPPATAAKGSKFAITETVSNEGLVGAGPSTTRYHLSLNTSRDATDKLLMGGSRAVPAIGAGSAHPAPTPVMVTVPTTVASGTYYVIACADDLKRVTEANETNNCRVSTTTVVVP
jgi:subtilase family serine protease